MNAGVIYISKKLISNLKLLHNIVQCGYSVSSVSSQCQSCGEVEHVEHMLYMCNRIHCIWNKVAECLKCEISWKKLVCGFTNPV